jgi:hypothetical protein
LNDFTNRQLADELQQIIEKKNASADARKSFLTASPDSTDLIIARWAGSAMPATIARLKALQMQSALPLPSKEDFSRSVRRSFPPKEQGLEKQRTQS